MSNVKVTEILNQKYQLSKDMLKIIIEAIPANVFLKIQPVDTKWSATYVNS